MLMGVKVGKLVDTVQDVGHQLLQEDARSHANFSSQSTGNGTGKFIDVCVTRLGRSYKKGGFQSLPGMVWSLCDLCVTYRWELLILLSSLSKEKRDVFEPAAFTQRMQSTMSRFRSEKSVRARMISC